MRQTRATPVVVFVAQQRVHRYPGGSSIVLKCLLTPHMGLVKTEAMKLHVEKHFEKELHVVRGILNSANDLFH